MSWKLDEEEDEDEDEAAVGRAGVMRKSREFVRARAC